MDLLAKVITILLNEYINFIGSIYDTVDQFVVVVVLSMNGALKQINSIWLNSFIQNKMLNKYNDKTVHHCFPTQIQEFHYFYKGLTQSF